MSDNIQFVNCDAKSPIREQSLIMAQTGAEEILMGCENFTDLVVGVWNNMSAFYWGIKKCHKMKFLYI